MVSFFFYSYLKFQLGYKLAAAEIVNVTSPDTGGPLYVGLHPTIAIIMVIKNIDNKERMLFFIFSSSYIIFFIIFCLDLLQIN